MATPESSSTLKRSKTKVVCLLILAVGVLAYGVRLAVQYRAFRAQLTVVRNVHISDSREEVMYRLGVPTHVLGELAEGEWGLSKWVYEVAGEKGDQNTMPSGTQVKDYSEWVYGEPNNPVRFTVEFDKTGLVKSLNLYCESSVRNGWGPVAGIYCGDSEEKVLRLGTPSELKLNGVSKTIEYSDLGLKITLSKGKAYMVTLKGVPQNGPSPFWRYLRQ